jgi:hypothetical protein
LFAAIAAASLSLATPVQVPAWVVGQVANLGAGLGDPSPRIVAAKLNQRVNGRLVDHVWLRGDFTCNFCSPQHNTHADAIIDVRRRFIIKWHVWN